MNENELNMLNNFKICIQLTVLYKWYTISYYNAIGKCIKEEKVF